MTASSTDAGRKRRAQGGDKRGRGDEGSGDDNGGDEADLTLDIALDYTWSVQDMEPDELRRFASGLGLAPGSDDGDDDVARLHRAVLARLRDADRVRDTLRALPPLALIAIELAVEEGGMIEVRTLYEHALARANATPEAVERALIAVDHSRLGILARDLGSSVRALLLVAESAVYVARTVLGVSLPPVRDVAPPVGPSRAHRDQIAVAAATAHARIRHNRDGTPHLGDVGRLARALGVDRAWLTGHLSRAIDAARCESDSAGALFPIRELLERQPTAATPVGACAHAWLGGSEKPVSLEAFLRAYVRVDPRHRQRSVLYLRPLRDFTPVDRGFAPASEPHQLRTPTTPYADEDIASLRQDLAEDDALWVSTDADGHEVLAWRGQRGHAAGFATPNFEVMLAPETDIAVVARIGLCAALTRIDHMLSYALTAASVRRGCALGVRVDELLSDLAAIGGCEPPQNVRETVRRWASGVAPARVLDGPMLVVGPDRARALRDTALGAWILGEPAPGALWLHPMVAGEQVRAAMVAIGADANDVAIPRDALAPVPDGVSTLAPPRPPLPLAAAPDPALRERVLNALAHDIESDLPPPTLFLELLAIIQAMRPQLARWHDRVPLYRRFWEGNIRDLEDLMDLPELTIPLVLLTERARARVLAQSSDIVELIDLAFETAVSGDIDPNAFALVSQVRQEIADSPEGSEALGDLGDLMHPDCNCQICEMMRRADDASERPDERPDERPAKRRRPKK